MAPAARRPHLHALVLPFPLQGHISPLLQLSEHLAVSHGFHITFVNTEYNHARLLQQTATKMLTFNNNNIRMVGVADGLPLDVERTAADMQRVVESMPVHTMPLLEHLISDLSKHCDNSITCIIADIFLPWAHELAKRCGISAFLGFHASSIAQFSFLYHIPLLVSTGQLKPDGTAKDGNEEKLLSGIPGVVDIPLSSAPWHVGDSIRNESTFSVLAEVSAVVEKLDCILFNSFTEIEKEALDALMMESKAKMAPVGPMLLLESSTVNVKPPCSTKVTSNAERCNGLQLDQERDPCLQWLDDKATHSVLYIAFGTTAWLSMEELRVLARGIELSCVPFLWVLRSDLLHGSESASALPHDFFEKTKERAYFTSWAPQTMILSHPAIGAFLTHGGWNSTLEAISLGVPMLLWPDFWDQKFHTEQVVEQWKVGLRLRSSTQFMSTTMRMESMSSSPTMEQAEQQWGSAEEVEKLVSCVMRGEEGKQMRKRATAMKDKAKLAVTSGSGSSYHNLQHVIRFVEAKLLKSMRS